MVQIYYCSFCGEEFNNKVNLHKHISDDHSDENQSPNEVLRCPLCEAIFYHLDAYELHLTFHSSKDLYSEQNELIEQITEFSLETVAPIMENVVEEQDTQPDEDNTMTNSDEINNFLQLVMGDQTDIAPEKVKHKKHKKHKKSKKASITLDEFLNMNKDVFGDGLGDVQGIEEVPTQVVLKKVKGKTQNRNDTKMVNADLAKLKKQGIIVKPKPKNKTYVKNLNTHSFKQKNIGNVIDINKSPSNATQNSPTDILSKLLNQGNSQIKIVKKSSSQNISNEDEHTKSVMSDIINNPSEGHSNLPPDNDIENIKDLDKISNIENPSNLTEEHKNDNKMHIQNLDFNGKDITTENEQSTPEYNKTKMTDDKEENIVSLDKAETHSITFSQGQPFKSLDDTKCAIVDNHTLTDNEDVSHDENNKLHESINYNNSDRESESNVANKTISALKHLSHLITVKPLANQNKDTIISTFTEENNSNNFNTDACDGNCSPKNISSDQQIPLNKSLRPFNDQKTINSPKESPLNILPALLCDTEIKDDCIDNMENNIQRKLGKKDVKINFNKNIIQMKELRVNLVPLPESTYKKYLLKNLSFQGSKDLILEKETIQEEKAKSDDFLKEESNLDILKRLPNVTAKPVNFTKISNQPPVNIKPLQTSNQVKVMLPKPKKFSKCIDEDLEVYNIDDSDDDTDLAQNIHNNEPVKKNINVPSDALKNLSKNITVKSSETKNSPNMVKDIKLESSSSRSECYSESYTRIKQSKEIQKSINLQNKLKTLGNITVKSRNSSPNVYNKDQYKAFEDFDEQANESGSDNENIGSVKITEVNDDYTSDNDFNDAHPEALIESPNASHSENEDNHDDFNEDLPDFENHIKTNTLNKNEVKLLKKPLPHLDNLKNLNKALTIKSINTKNSEQESNFGSQKEVPEDTIMPNQEMAIKPYRPNISQNEQSSNKNIYQASGSTSQSSLNQKVNTGSNQVNTVKTVNTVKRFQSQTVIEEITTTVTKTIRTVNSSTNEVMQATTSQNTPKPINRPQKIINKQPGRELQGTAVRHASPTIGTKIRNAVPVVRTPKAPLIRPSNQLVPVRPVFNRPRCPTPSTSAIRKVIPPRSSPQKPAIGKLKISPHALNQTTKRPSEEAFSHFTSFKKPKDSLVASPDLQDFSDDDSSMQYSSASQSRSDFSSVSKNIKGKGIMTATQTRSEFSTCSQQQTSKGMTATQMRSEICMSSQQQLSRLSNMSGLKVVKTSSKQATQVEEKCEINPGKSNTLQALEKLQKQGLLVKKPRIEEYNDQGNSFSESDDEMEK